VEQLGRAAVEGFKAIRKRGLEVGGFLLGSFEKDVDFTAVWIRAFEPFESEHRNGPSYVLSENDERKLSERIELLLRRHGEDGIVGFYRSHTRPDFRLTQHDAQLLSRYFPNSAQVFLLIKPTPNDAGTAGFFVRQNGEIRIDTANVEFPFAVRDLATGAFPTVEDAPQDPTSTEAPPALCTGLLKINEPPGQTWAHRAHIIRVPRALRIKWAYTTVPLMAVLASVALILQRPHERVRPPVPHRAEAPDAVTLHRASGSGVADAAVTPAVGPLALSVTWDGNRFRLTWNRNAPAINAGANGVLTIADGPRRKSWKLKNAQLMTGSILYVPATDDVEFRLEVLFDGESVTESVHILRPPSLQSSETRMREPVSTQPKRPSPAERANARRAGATRIPHAETDQGKSAHVIPPSVNSSSRAITPAPIEELAASPQTIQASPSPEPIAQPAATAPRPTPAHLSSVSALPVAHSKVGRVLAKIPLVRRLRKPNEITPPRPIRQSPLSMPADFRPDAQSPVTVDVKVYVNESGRVEYAEPLSDVTATNRVLASLAVYNARRWEFEPAHDAEGKRPGEVVLRYRFGHGQKAIAGLSSR
jgi:hypothetical protein